MDEFFQVSLSTSNIIEKKIPSPEASNFEYLDTIESNMQFSENNLPENVKFYTWQEPFMKNKFKKCILEIFYHVNNQILI